MASAVAVPIKMVMQLHPQKNCTKTSFILTMSENERLTATNGPLVFTTVLLQEGLVVYWH